MHIHSAKQWVLPTVAITWSLFAETKFQLIQPGQISTFDYMGESNLILARQDSFSPSICLDLPIISFNFFCKDVLNYFFILPMQAEGITWENFVLTNQDLGSTNERSHLARTELLTCNCRIKFMKSWSTAGKWDRISSVKARLSNH